MRHPLPPPPTDRAASRRHAAVTAFYVAAALLNGPQLEQAAERIEYGRRLRPVALALARPVAAAARAARLDRPRAWVERFADRFLRAGAAPLAPGSDRS